jgi:hypothetical protein
MMFGAESCVLCRRGAFYSSASGPEYSFLRAKSCFILFKPPFSFGHGVGVIKCGQNGHFDHFAFSFFILNISNPL